MSVQRLDKLPPGLVFRALDLDFSSLPAIDSHLHTSWTDGSNSVPEMYAAAVEAGLATILFSEHSRKSSTDWFPDFAAEVRALPKAPCRAYVGTEVKVESRDGRIDTSDEITRLCDFVVASVHRFVAEDGSVIQFADTKKEEAVDLEFALTCAVLSNPGVDILGHMFGMSHKRFGLTPPDEKVYRIIQLAAQTGVAIELNSSYHHHLYQLIDWCRECDAYITFGSDAHHTEQVGAIGRRLVEGRGW